MGLPTSYARRTHIDMTTDQTNPTDHEINFLSLLLRDDADAYGICQQASAGDVDALRWCRDAIASMGIMVFTARWRESGPRCGIGQHRIVNGMCEKCPVIVSNGPRRRRDTDAETTPMPFESLADTVKIPSQR